MLEDLAVLVSMRIGMGMLVHCPMLLLLLRELSHDLMRHHIQLLLSRGLCPKLSLLLLVCNR